MTTLDEKALEIAMTVEFGVQMKPEIACQKRAQLQVLIIAALKSEVKSERRAIFERISASDLLNKNEVKRVVFPNSTPSVTPKWVDLSKEG